MKDAILPETSASLRESEDDLVGRQRSNRRVRLLPDVAEDQDRGLAYPRSQERCSLCESMVADAEHDHIEAIAWLDRFTQPSRDCAADALVTQSTARVDEVCCDLIAVHDGSAWAHVELDIMPGRL